MQQVLDLHVHSRFSRACSPRLSLENIATTCVAKGVDIVSTGDFTHPLWFKEIKEKLEEIGQSSLFRLKDSYCVTKFILGTELSLVYRDQGKTRRVHILVYAPSIDCVSRLNNKLSERFNLRSDGRPILGLSVPELCKMCWHISEDFLIYPAHIWTPWYSVLGSKSGFDSFKECFQEYDDRISAFETGLSSDPEMNSQIPFLSKRLALSSSDAHSLNNIGREASVFMFENDAQINYPTILKIIRGQGDERNYCQKTIEFYPEEGMYYLDGHRDCLFSCLPKESEKLNNLCPICKRPLTIGVLNRVLSLSVKKEKKKLRKFVKIVELDKVIAETVGIKSRQSVRVKRIYQELINQHGSELQILLNVNLEELSDKKIAQAISMVRKGLISLSPGFDGQYGIIKLGIKK